MKKILPNVTLAALVLISANLRSDVDDLMSFDAHSEHVVESSGSLNCRFHMEIDPNEMRSQYLPEVSPEWSVDPSKSSDYIASDDSDLELADKVYEHPEWSLDPDKVPDMVAKNEIRPELIAENYVRPEWVGEKRRSELLIENEVRPEFLVKNDVRPELIVKPDVRTELKLEDDSQGLSF